MNYYLVKEQRSYLKTFHLIEEIHDTMDGVMIATIGGSLNRSMEAVFPRHFISAVEIASSKTDIFLVISSSSDIKTVIEKSIDNVNHLSKIMNQYASDFLTTKSLFTVLQEIELIGLDVYLVMKE